jgi:Putative zinc-finger
MNVRQEEGRVLCSEPDLSNLFLSYIVGDVEPDERRKIDEHLTGCATCRGEIKFFSDLQRAGEELFGDE